MSRMQGLSKKKAGFFTRLLYWLVKRSVGKLVEPVQVMAYSTPVTLGYSMMEAGQKSAKRVDAALKELLQVKVAMLVGCPF